MRRRDREITDRNEMIEVMKKCDVCRIAMNDGEYPYILPLNFGLSLEDDTIVLYFHGADSGKKYELFAKDNRVSFEMDCSHQLVLDDEKKTCTMKYESVIGQGRIEIVPDEEKMKGLKILMRQYRNEDFPFNSAAVPRTTVFKLVVEKMTGKRR